ncbi:hypothetical protein [Aestuariirhabdus litorea]|uniref:Periplasmic heavy metal sensor n=1 Tax=Aestuariirhabdus litorea TaxID=2528527 RepID=A0A3P3VNR7_9GAMM|nr:hypothetical protein [Aestuariirhabdus litorea]RRJ83296.1 hypothetical protein D0544_15855 [Aestuariirhabdus litorea]RWW93456.1 hypothetical protein DZC74_15825 [Endozoicomonadaceae bacterium GTF-13]
MKMRWLLVPALLGGAAIAVAQPGGFGGGMMGGYGAHHMGEFYQALDLSDEQKDKAEQFMRERRVERMAQRMGLDAEQQEQVLKLMDSHQAERDALLKKYGLTPDKQAEFATEMQAMRAAHHAAMEGLLTDEQRAGMHGRGHPYGYGKHHRGLGSGGMGGYGMHPGYGKGFGMGPGCDGPVER